MIVKMKKVTIVAYGKNEKQVVSRLRDLGIIHISHINKPESERLDLLKKEIDMAEKSIAILKSFKSKVEKLPCDSPIETVKSVFGLMERRNHYLEKDLSLKKEI